MTLSLAFDLTFHAVGTVPTRKGSCLLYNQCDGYHVVEAWFFDGAFQGFHFFGDGESVPDDFYVAWAELPDSAGQLFNRFACKETT